MGTNHHADDTPSMVVLNPGDRVLISFSRDTDLNQIRSTMAQLRGQFPCVDFTALVGPNVIVQHEEENANDR